MSKVLMELFIDGKRMLRTNDKEEFEKEKKKFDEQGIKYDQNIRKLYEEVVSHDKEELIK